MGPLAECHLQQGENLLREHVKGDHTHQKDAPGTGEHVGTRFNPLEARFYEVCQSLGVKNNESIGRMLFAVVALT